MVLEAGRAVGYTGEVPNHQHTADFNIVCEDEYFVRRQNCAGVPF